MSESRPGYSLGRMIIHSLSIAIATPIVVVVPSWDLGWIEGWMLVAWFVAMLMTNLAYMYRKDPELIVERLTAHGRRNQSKRDKLVLRTMFAVSALWILAIPLDSRLIGLSPRFPWWLEGIGFALLLPAFFLCVRATVDNPFLSTVVRIQSDRAQTVVSSGSYAVIRHPQYAGISCLLVGAPLLTGSLVGIGLGAALVALLVLRIFGEEKTLLEGLPGYGDYMKKVKYRLIPGLW